MKSSLWHLQVHQNMSLCFFCHLRIIIEYSVKSQQTYVTCECTHCYCWGFLRFWGRLWFRQKINCITFIICSITRQVVCLNRIVMATMAMTVLHGEVQNVIFWRQRRIFGCDLHETSFTTPVLKLRLVTGEKFLGHGLKHVPFSNCQLSCTYTYTDHVIYRNKSSIVIVA